MSAHTTFQQYLQTAFTTGPWASEEVIAFVLPLFEEVLSLHENGLVAPFEKPDALFITDGRPDIDEEEAHPFRVNLPAVTTLLEYRQLKGYHVTERLLVDEDVTASKAEVINLHVHTDLTKDITHPVYLPGYQCYELKVGHHDVQTDIFCLGLLLGSAVTGLNLYDTEDLNEFVAYRTQPAGLNPRVHPTICALVTEMTELDRAARTRDLQEAIQRLKYYRDYDPHRQTDLAKLAAFQVKKPTDRRSFILSKLRNRLFDTSRRNRLLYYKSNSRFVNLTVSSVPMVLHYQSINPQTLFTWNTELSTRIIGMKDIALNKYLRFEDHPYLNAQLNSIRQQSENDKKEYGFSQLKLAVAFLHWHNLKEVIHERIQSPLLLLPVELERKKSLKEERFTLKIIDNTAIINPVLANYLKDLYGITLPESIDFDEVSMEQFYELLKYKISEAKQGVVLNYIDKPRIRIIHNIARQTINNYRKRLKKKSGPAFHRIDYSYSDDYYKPLGLELFRQKVKPQQSALEFLLSKIPPRASSWNFADPGVSVKETFHLTDGENNPYSWDFDVSNIILGNFNYKKMSLVSDYNAITDRQIEHAVFDELFSAAPKNAEAPHIENNPIGWYHVIPADPTQAKSVLYSRTGKSYIIQGPPGTGKSQTITNLIADFLANDKVILFVCEKRAALDVVYHRLQQNQLAELCCYIHDSQGDKKEFIKDLRTVYEDFLQNRMDLPAITAKREQVLNRLQHKLEVLQHYHLQQRKTESEAGVSTRELIETLVKLREHVPQLTAVTGELVPYYDHWIQFGKVVQQLGKALEETGVEPQLANHPLGNLGNTVVKADNPFTLMDSLVTHCHTTIRQLSDIIAKNNIPAAYAAALENIKNLIQDSVLLEPLAQTNNLSLVSAHNCEAREFEKAYAAYKELQEAYRQAVDNNKRWLNKPDRQELEQAIALAQKHEKSLFGFLNGNWRKLKKQLNLSYDFSSHQVKPMYSMVLKQLMQEYQYQDKAAATKKELQQRYQVDNIDTIYVGIEVLRRKRDDKELEFLLQHPESKNLVLQLSRLNNTLHQLELQLAQCLFEYSGKSLSQVNDELTNIRSNEDALKYLLPALRKFSELPDNLQQLIRKLPLTPLQAEAAMANKTMELLCLRNQQFSGTNYRILQDTVADIEKLYKELLQLNSEYIRAKRRQKFLEHYELSNTSATLLTPEQKLLKKQYTDGRRILEHEMSKTMRYKSIREMASNESGQVLKDIKPVWLMSPLSVSDSLPLDTGFFDVVIFDEASQITLEEGIPALFRGPQSIIVGDDKQMPPSNFFNAKTEDPDDLEIFNGEKEDEILTTEADSLLDQGSRKLNSTMLSWHYRSRYETLISYSNHAFYEAGLLTIPDKTIHHQERVLREIHRPDEGYDAAGSLLDSSISFHYLPDSIYEARSNMGEAKYIAQLVRGLLLNNVEETIGIVAFSQEQQGTIEEAIDNLAAEDKAFGEALEKAYNRKDEGQFTGLFIKNLENVQGDERDIIIMSVCYGHDSRRKMLMNFGPINRKGGEKRLNVIFSRAKKHMAVVSSIRHFHITNDYNEGANYFKRFLQYAEMVSTGNMQAARSILDTLITTEKSRLHQVSQFTVTSAQVKAALEAKGYTVDEQIGQSSFKCTLAIKKHPQDRQYTMGILIDDEKHYGNNDLVEQYYQRPSILQAFGWKVITVFSKDWLEDPQYVLSIILRRLEGNYDHEALQNEASNKTVAPVIPQRRNEKEDLVYTYWYTNNKDKFWAIAQKGAQLFTRSGKAGTQGLSQVKTCASAEEAAEVKQQMILGAEQNGYKRAE